MNSSPTPPRKRRVILILIILVIGVVLAALFNSATSNLPNQIVWLTPSEFDQIKRVGPLTRLKFQLAQQASAHD